MATRSSGRRHSPNKPRGAAVCREPIMANGMAREEHVLARGRWCDRPAARHDKRAVSPRSTPEGSDMARALIHRVVFCTLAVWLTNAPLWAGEKIVAYVPNWLDFGKYAESIDFSKITPHQHRFRKPDRRPRRPVVSNEERRAHPEGPREQRQGVGVHRRRRGGRQQGDEGALLRVAADARRAGFVAKLASYVTDHGFDGLDVDIEGPSITRITGRSSATFQPL